MLIEFSVGNYRSFKEPVTFSMVAAKITSQDPRIDENNINVIDKHLTLLTTSAIYGNNASGKSNLYKAITFMKWFILNSSKETQSDEPIKIDTFRLSEETENKPAFFQMVFLIDNIKYRYGFEVTTEKVVSEWLFYTPTIREGLLFLREESGFKLSRSFKEGNKLEEKTRINTLFLSVVAQFNGQISNKIINWFQKMGTISGVDDTRYRGFTIGSFAEGRYKNDILELIKKLDIGVKDINIEKLEKAQISFHKDISDDIKKMILKDLEKGGSVYAINTKHTKFNEKGIPTGNEMFGLDMESNGTQKLFFLAGPIIDTLSKGKILIIDEFEARLHPLITRALVQLFNSIDTNLNRAQLIFTTHDINLLSKELFRRDQIWFIEKDSRGASHLFSLAELKVRNDALYEKDYIQGKYGAIPYLGNVQNIVCEE